MPNNTMIKTYFRNSQVNEEHRLLDNIKRLDAAHYLIYDFKEKLKKCIKKW